MHSPSLTSRTASTVPIAMTRLTLLNNENSVFNVADFKELQNLITNAYKLLNDTECNNHVDRAILLGHKLYYVVIDEIFNHTYIAIIIIIAQI